LKFLVDMPVTPQVVAYLEAAGHGAVHASSVGLALASDTQILEVALVRGVWWSLRISTTRAWSLPRKLPGPGLSCSGEEPIRTRTSFASSSRVLGRADQLDLEHSITVVERGRIRRRALPLR
jgi:hypothetical protein